METTTNQSKMVGITEITTQYLPISKKRARRFVMLYLTPKYIGNRIFVDRAELEQLLNDQLCNDFPLS